MKPYAEREVFTVREIRMYKRAAEIVSALEEHLLGVDDEIRCHELAHVVHAVLIEEMVAPDENFPFKPVLCHGRWGAVEHSWIEWRSADYRRTVLDVYVPGSLPQVQLVDASELLGRRANYVHDPVGFRGYQEGALQELLDRVNRLRELATQ